MVGLHDNTISVSCHTRTVPQSLLYASKTQSSLFHTCEPSHRIPLRSRFGRTISGITPLRASRCDGDLPTEWECRLLSRHWSLRLLWLSSIVAYAVRPLLVTERPPLSRDLVANWVVQLLFNALWVHWFGWRSYVYLVSCVLEPGRCIHARVTLCRSTTASVQERNEDAFPQETFSYYGPLNL